MRTVMRDAGEGGDGEDGTARKRPLMDTGAASAWWDQRRRTFNVALLASGVVAFALYAVVVQMWPTGSEVEIAAFTVAAQAVGFGVAVLLANVCYSLGARVERFLHADGVAAYRRAAWWLGLVFSVALPQAVPLLAVLRWTRP